MAVRASTEGESVGAVGMTEWTTMRVSGDALPDGETWHQVAVGHVSLCKPSGDVMLFDVRGEAVCPTCGARWCRVLNLVQLVE